MALIALAFASPGTAQAPVELVVDPCLGVDTESVRRIVSIELELELHEVTTPRETTLARASCDDEDGARLDVEDPTTGKSSSRRLRFRTLEGAGRARLLALALAELIAASWAELRLSRATAAHDVDATASRPMRIRVAEVAARRFVLPPPRPTAPQPRVRQPRGRAFLTGSIGVAAEPAHLLGGGGFEVLLDISPRLSLAAGVDALQGRVRRVDGDVLTSRLGFSSSVLLRQPVRHSWVAFGLGGRVGRALLRGALNVEGARSVAAPFGGAFVVGHVWRQVWRLLFALRLEVGVTTAAVRARVGAADGPIAAAVDGPWGTLSLGVGLTL